MLFLYLYIFVQIFLESFPVSSSGHIALLQLCHSFLYPSSTTAFSTYISTHVGVDQNSFDALLHASTLIILFFFFFTRWFFLLRHPWRCRFIIAKLLSYIFVSTAIALAFYFVFHIQDWALPLGIGFLITACTAFSLRRCPQGTGSLTLSSSFIVGVVQAVALLPGISRLGTTYAVSRWLGISNRRSFEISFLIQAPLILAAFAKSALVLMNEHCLGQILNLPIVLVMMMATGAAWYGLRLSAYTAIHNYWWYFALYMMLPLGIWLVLIFIA